MMTSNTCPSYGTRLMWMYIFVFAFLTLSTRTATATDANLNTPEIVINSTENTLRLKAKSNGCTRATDFAFSKDTDNQIVATRIRADTCRRKSLAVTFVYELSTVCQTIEEAGTTVPVVLDERDPKTPN